ncbi:MAG: hypothetical protein KA712_11100 [Myxococcales bacterium]|nr:hypothetical protein [Myxococcales bacterium]
MDKESERAFVEAFTQALVSLPFDMKVLVEAVVDPDLTEAVREVAAAALIHSFTPKDRHVEPYLRHTEDVVFLRLALQRVRGEGSEASKGFEAHWAESFTNLDEELRAYREVFGEDIVDWLDARWPLLRKGVLEKKHPLQYVRDEALGQTLYDHASDFATEYPVTERSLGGRVRALCHFVEHLQRKHEQDKLMIHSVPQS